MASKEEVEKTKLSVIGVKPAESTFHERLRIIIVMFIVGTMSWLIYQEDHKQEEEGELQNYINENSILYRSINEVDPICKKKYIKFLKTTFEAKEETIFDKYYKNVVIALGAGICSEYIITGNLSKPLGVVSKTVLYSSMNTLLSL
jgi:hypothetical protein